MTEQLWGIGGVVIGIAASGGTSWALDQLKHRRETADAASVVNKQLCEEFLASIELELRATEKFLANNNDMFPFELGHDPSPANARVRLTEIDIKCPNAVHTLAHGLAESLESWIWSVGTIEEYQSARAAFIDAIKTKL